MAQQGAYPPGFTMGAWYQSVDPASVLLPITAVPDQHLVTQVNDIRVPTVLTKIIGRAALANDASLIRAQLQSPSLNGKIKIDVEPLVAAAKFPDSQQFVMMGMDAVDVKETEGINMAILSDPAAPVAHYGLIWFGDKPRVPVAGPMYTLRGTGVAALAAGAWVATPITLSQQLPVGSYQVVGFRARGANLVAARLVFLGYPWRPGCPGVSTLAQQDNLEFRYGNLGIWGTFDNTTVPSVECLGITDTTQVFEIDVIPLQ